MIPFLDLQSIHHEIRTELSQCIERVLCSGQYVNGVEVEAFEEEWACFTGARHAVGVGNGLDALRLALEAVGVRPGDEVIVPSHTFFATWLAVAQLGAVPVGVEPCDGFLIGAETVALAITCKTKAVVAVHLYGQPVQLEPILALASQHGIAVVEDAAQAHGAQLQGVPVGAHSDAVAWSFYPGKNLGALGDAGAVTTHRKDVADTVRCLRNYGSSERYRHTKMGVNSRLDALQAAVLRTKLRFLPEWNARRQAQAARYKERLVDLCGIQLPEAQPLDSVWHLFVVQHFRRGELQAHLTEQGVQAQIHYPIPCHRQEAISQAAFDTCPSPKADRWAETVLSLPIGPHMMETGGRAQHSKPTVDAVCDSVLRWFDKAGAK